MALFVLQRKCHQYWPEEKERYADINVQNHKTEVFADYVIRTLLLSKVRYNASFISITDLYINKI
jgi:hypothetical protein